MSKLSITHLCHNEIDKKKWDHTLEHSANGIVYAASWYLDIVCAGWEALVADDYKFIFPLAAKKKYRIQYLYPPCFTQQLGLFSPERLNAKLVEQFVHAIPGHFRYMEINLNHENKFLDRKYNAKLNLTHHLRLSRSYEKLESSFSSNHKRNIRKALNAELKITNDDKHEEEVVRLFRNNKAKNISGYKSSDYEVLARLLKEAQKRNLLQTLKATNENDKMIVGAFFIKSFQSWIFLFSGSDEEAKKKSAMHLLINEFIKQHAGENMYLDFEGSNNPSLARFYKGFGSEEIVYLQIRKNNLPKLIKWMKK